MSTCRVNVSKFWEDPILGIWVDKDGRTHGTIFQMLRHPELKDGYWGLIYDCSPCPMHNDHNFCISVSWPDSDNEQRDYQAATDYVYGKKKLAAQSLFTILEKHRVNEGT